MTYSEYRSLIIGIIIGLVVALMIVTATTFSHGGC